MIMVVCVPTRHAAVAFQCPSIPGLVGTRQRWMSPKMVPRAHDLTRFTFLACSSPVNDAGGMKEMQPTGDVQRHLPATSIPRILSSIILCESPLKVTSLQQLHDLRGTRQQVCCAAICHAFMHPSSDRVVGGSRLQAVET